MSYYATQDPIVIEGLEQLMFLLWTAIVLIVSPLLFFISVSLPEIPLQIIRRFQYVSFDSDTY